MHCEECITVPYVAHEGAMARMERTVKRLWILLLVLVVLLVGTNIAWFVYESQFETVAENVTQDVWQDSESGNNSFIGGDSYGEAAR